ncbi:MAG: rod shape-determining protein MreB [Terrisporobacter sp.]
MAKGAEIGIDLGTANILVYVNGKGVVLEEPSVVAIDKNTKTVLAVGEEARRMIGRTPGNIVAIRPLKNGVISDYDITEKMLTYYVNKVIDKKGLSRFFMPKIMVCVPTGVTDVEKRAVEEATRQAGAREVYIIEEPIAAAIGAGIDISKADGNMVVDIGGGTADIAVISLGGDVVSESIKMGGDKFDEYIVTYMRKHYNLLIGDRTAEQIKMKIGTAYPREEEVSMDVKGRNLVTGLPQKITIDSSEMLEALKDGVNQIVCAVHAVLEKTPPELAADISETGIIMTGGGALLHGLDKKIEERTGIEVRIADDPLSCVAKGTGESLSALSLLETGGTIPLKKKITKGEN